MIGRPHIHQKATSGACKANQKPVTDQKLAEPFFSEFSKIRLSLHRRDGA